MSFASCQGSDLTVRNLTILGDLIMDTTTNEGTSNNDNIITNLIQSNNYINSINLNDSHNGSITMQSNQDLRFNTHGGSMYLEDVSGNQTNFYVQNGLVQASSMYSGNYTISNGFSVRPLQIIINNSNLTNQQFYLSSINALSYSNTFVCDNTNTGDVYIILNHEYDGMKIVVINQTSSHNVFIQNESGGNYYGLITNTTNFELPATGNKMGVLEGIAGNWYVMLND